MFPVLDDSETVAFRILTALGQSAASRAFGMPLKSVFDDLEIVLGPDYLPPDDAIPDLTLRMRGHLMLLLGAAREYETDDLRSARDLLDREVPGDYTGTRVHLRRMALACLRLLAFSTPYPPPGP
ncbi:DUF6415 family natural product biosynthesis protein [Streptomyces lavendulae]|uniref:DUF6415 family natural product biosynthesis protein n=1 Tax=Streptomyces lavendulae TaxID=1914 RepID=UPI0038035F10